jgi:hypothetical protein
MTVMLPKSLNNIGKFQTNVFVKFALNSKRYFTWCFVEEVFS